MLKVKGKWFMFAITNLQFLFRGSNSFRNFLKCENLTWTIRWEVVIKLEEKKIEDKENCRACEIYCYIHGMLIAIICSVNAMNVNNTYTTFKQYSSGFSAYEDTWDVEGIARWDGEEQEKECFESSTLILKRKKNFRDKSRVCTSTTSDKRFWDWKSASKKLLAT